MPPCSGQTEFAGVVLYRYHIISSDMIDSDCYGQGIFTLGEGIFSIVFKLIE